MPDEPHQLSRLAEELVGDFRGIPYQEPRKQKLRATRNLAAVTEDLIAKFQIGRESPEQIIRDHWPELVGSANASYSHAARLERGGRMLVVTVSHSVVRNELFLHRHAIVAKIQKLPSCSGIKELNLRAG